MEELQDAIEDAQYVNAIATQEEGPRPVLRWETPDPEQLAAWQETKKPGFGTFDWTLSSPIGFFLFSSFVKEKHNDYVRMNFCEEVLRFKKARGRQRDAKGQEILELYITRITEESFAPKRKEINEYDMERKIPSKKLTKEEVGKLLKVSMDYPTCSECSIGLKGPTRKEILSKFEELRTASKLASKYSSMRTIEPLNLSVQSAPAESSRSMTAAYNREDAIVSEPFSPTTRVSVQSAPTTITVGDSTQEDVEEPSKVQIPTESSKPQSIEISNSILSQDFLSEDLSAPVDALDDDNDVHADDSNEEKREEPQQSSSGSPTASPRPQRQSSLTTPSEELRASIRKSLRSTVGKSTIPSSFFDEAELVVAESLRRDYFDLFLESEEYKRFQNFLWYQDRPVVPEDFFVMRVLGRGGFGLVTACKKGTSGKLYAMKVMNKKRIKIKKAERLALNEREVLSEVESNFVVNLKYSFHSKEDVFLILDLMTGGDLGFHLHQKGRFPKKECQYYAARIMLGLQALHDHNYVYRDLKPENCLLAEDGRVKITDLGLATKIVPGLHGAAGTRGYWAPEMLRRDSRGKRMSYGHTVDWFSFGCCVAEFISGSNPFRSEAALNFGLAKGKQTKEKAIDCATLEMEPEFSSSRFEPDAADLCRRLLDKNEKTRLGRTGCEEIMAHPWFKNVNWDSIISDRKRPPYVPPKDVNAASQSEIGNFVEDNAYKETQLTEADDIHYADWDWTNPHAFAAEVIEFLIYERETGEPLVPIMHDGTCCCTIL